MQELEKILEEIEEYRNHVCEDYSRGIEFVAGAKRAFNGIDHIIRKHMNDDWVSVEERLPEESGYYRVTVKNTELGDITEETAWFAHMDDYNMDESDWRELYEYEEVIAWRELSPYRPERSKK